MKNDSHVYFDNPEIVKAEGGMGRVVIAGASLVIGFFGPMIVNLAVAAFNIAEGKPLITLKKESEK